MTYPTLMTQIGQGFGIFASLMNPMPVYDTVRMTHGGTTISLKPDTDRAAVAEWLAERGLKLNRKLVVVINDPDIAFEFKMRWL